MKNAKANPGKASSNPSPPTKASGVRPKVRKPSKRKHVSKVANAQAKLRHGGHREASDPGPQRLRVLCCNTQGAEGTSRFYRNLVSFSPPPNFILLQEVSFSQSLASSFRSSVQRSSFNFYFQQGAPNRRLACGNRISGGVAILVRKDLDQKDAFSKSGGFSQSIYVWVNGCIFGSVYAPPHAESPAEAAAQFLDLQVACEVPCSSPGFIGGTLMKNLVSLILKKMFCLAWLGCALG